MNLLQRIETRSFWMFEDRPNTRSPIIPGSVNVPVQVESFEELVAKLDPSKKYIVHCTSNHFIGRSNRALKSMQNLGFKHLYSLKGGYDGVAGRGTTID